jgi:hypothetical protein
MLMLRKDDGATRDAPYTPGVGPGRWRPHPNTLPPNPPIANPDMARGYAASILPGRGNVAPFTLLSASQFWLPGPPALTSATYARDFNEVKSVGGRVSTVRHGRADGDRAVLVRGPRGVEQDFTHDGHDARPRCA